MAHHRITELLLILGKRLVNEKPTTEGIARVRVAVDYLANIGRGEIALGFCGGPGDGQSTPEAIALYSEFRRQCASQSAHVLTGPIFFDFSSTNTIENVRNISEEIVESNLLHPGDQMEVKLVSSDYHIDRLLKIQRHMDEFGTLRTFSEIGARLGVTLVVRKQRDAHLAAQYPYDTSALGQVYRQVDRLTIYQVYLEGVIASAFSRSLKDVRVQPLHEVQIAMKAIRGILSQDPDLEGRCSDVISAAVQFLERTIGSTAPQVGEDDVRGHWAFYNSVLTTLNRYVDPECSVDER